jgi:general secretion pathway protein J
MNGNKGFTLLEILIAMAIFTLIGLASTSVLTSVINSDKLSSERFDKLEKLQRAMLVIERDILQAQPRAVRLVGEENKQVITGGKNLFESDADGLHFVRSGWHNPQLMLPRSTLQSVVYRLRDNKLQRLYGNYVDNVIGWEPKEKTLLADVEDFKVEYLVGDLEDSDSESEWQETYTALVLPRAIAIEITTKDFGFIRREFLMGAGQG